MHSNSENWFFLNIHENVLEMVKSWWYGHKKVQIRADGREFSVTLATLLTLNQPKSVTVHSNGLTLCSTFLSPVAWLPTTKTQVLQSQSSSFSLFICNVHALETSPLLLQCESEKWQECLCTDCCVFLCRYVSYILKKLLIIKVII